MVGNDLTTPSSGGGLRLLLNNLTVNYYTGKYNGCYKMMWFRFGDWCSDQDEFGYEPGHAKGCGNFTEGRAPDDGWFKGDLYQVGTPKPSTPKPTLAPVPTPPVARAPVRNGPTNRPASINAPVRVIDKPVRTTGAPIRVGPIDRPLSHPVTQPKPVPRPTEPIPAPAPATQRQPVNPVFCHFRYC
jgi:hypothetical protein